MTEWTISMVMWHAKELKRLTLGTVQQSAHRVSQTSFINMGVCMHIEIRPIWQILAATESRQLLSGTLSYLFSSSSSLNAILGSHTRQTFQTELCH